VGKEEEEENAHDDFFLEIEEEEKEPFQKPKNEIEKSRRKPRTDSMANGVKRKKRDCRLMQAESEEEESAHGDFVMEIEEVDFSSKNQKGNETNRKLPLGVKLNESLRAYKNKPVGGRELARVRKKKKKNEEEEDDEEDEGDEEEEDDDDEEDDDEEEEEEEEEED
jgi:hypothetical protein